ncbi:cupin domain-containing protein [Microcella alkalica]|uniref:Quercetin dioxygenase-like cupin family protein n=1 Tax=Microcella alkalica TaxID=355930 RepID=A0A839ED89_9MICO|nr:cupin domain-containing protein [Microcella alkalica]MBA8849063.1 quercetin dioxygenase-like cupin family protein [Microcella alkalica]
MTGAQSRSFDSPDEQRTPPKTRVDILKLEGTTAGRFTFEPGWRWSEAVKPIAGTDSCQARHVGAVVAGRLHVAHGDGSEFEAGPGDAYVIEPGHDAWVVGDETYVGYEFESMTAEQYARGS